MSNPAARLNDAPPSPPEDEDDRAARRRTWLLGNIALGMVALGFDTRKARLDELTRRTGRPIPVFAVLTDAEAETISAQIEAEVEAEADRQL